MIDNRQEITKMTIIKKKLNRDCFHYSLMIECIISACITLLVLWFLYALMGYAPFGSNSLACMDADIQYLDFFSWLKNVLAGHDNVTYTFSKVLGGTAVGIYSYYLASPFSLLVIFFKKSQLHTFFNTIVSLKLALAATFCTIFLNCRFKIERESSVWRRIILIMLSVSYALGQYSIAQASNIQWLDGVYMLPLILLGVYHVIEKNRGAFLSITVACSILFNWYTGGINCLFAIIWFLFEFILTLTQESNQPEENIKKFFSRGIWFCCWMAIGVMLSGVLFLPTIGAMQKSTRGALQLGLLKDISFLGNILTSIEAYTPGAMSSLGTAALYAGSLPLLGCGGFFLNKEQKNIKKGIYAALFITTLLLFYWNPLYRLFSLLKSATSYWYRFSYIGIIVLVFISADFFLYAKSKEISRNIIVVGIVYSLSLIFLNYATDHSGINVILISITLVFISITGISACNYVFSEKVYAPHSLKYFSIAVLGIITSLEIGYGVSKQMENYHVNNVNEYTEYVSKNQKQIDEIKNRDIGIYRISQTSTRRMYQSGLTANYNEGMAFHYWSVAGYSSSPDTNQLDFLDRLGYRKNCESFGIVNTSILGTDSLLGVKYILSKYPINGLDCINKIPKQNGKYVFENPYALPLAFIYESNNKRITDQSNPFEYQNRVFSLLSGQKADIYHSLEYSKIIGDDGSQIYKVSIPKGNYVIYGNLPWDDLYEGTVDVNKEYKIQYAGWLSPSVFYIPYETENNSDDFEERLCTVAVKSDHAPISIKHEQFYALDLDRFNEIISSLKKRTVSEIEIRNGYAYFEAEAVDENEYLFLSIPFDDCWRFSCNGKDIEPELFENCLYSIPLKKGDNKIKMVYHVKYMYVGMLCTIVGMLFIVILSALKGSVASTGTESN